MSDEAPEGYVHTTEDGRRFIKRQGQWVSLGHQSTLGGTVRAGLEGLTMGFSGEMGSALAAIPASIQTGEAYGDVYSEMLKNHSAKMADFSDQHPVLSTGAEIAGGVSTGLVGAGKLAASRVGQALMTNAPKWAVASGLGGVEGGLYGAGTAEEDNRLSGAVQGATIGAIAAPVGGWLVEKLGNAGGRIFQWAKNKLSSTPRKEAISSIRRMLEAEGMDVDDAVAIYERLGREGMLADLGENFRSGARAAVDTPGPAKAVARDFLNERQMGAGGRMLGAAEGLVGARADDLTSTVADIARRRAEAAKPVYDLAFSQGIDFEDDALKEVLNRDAVKKAMRQAKRWASNLGDDFGENSMKHLHYAKMALWGQIDSAKGRAKGPLKKAYGDLLDAIGQQNETYIRANGMWASDSQLIDAATTGRDLLRMSVSEMRDTLSGMSSSEREMFEMGAMAAFKDAIDNTPFTHDATRKLTSTPALREKMTALFGDKAEDFMTAAWREGEFGRTRNVISGGSPTSQNLAGQQWLEDSIQPTRLLDFMRGDPIGAALNVATDLLKDKPMSQATLKELQSILLNRGMPESEVRKILTSPQFKQGIQRMTNPLYPRAAAGIATPILLGEQ